jgi:hypothetical protein
LIEGIYDYGYVERVKPDTSIEAQLRIRAKRMNKNHIHQFSVVGVKNDVVHKRCLLCREEYMEPTWSRAKKDKTDDV